MYPPCGDYSTSYKREMTFIRTRTQWGLLTGLLVLLYAFPLTGLVSKYVVRATIDLFIVIIAVQGINIVTGFCGQVTLGQAGFVCIGAYISALLTHELGYPFWIAIISAGIGTTVIGIIFALPAGRVKELYLALSTVAAQFLIFWAVRYVPQMFGKVWGATGVDAPAPTLGWMVFDTSQKYYYLSLTVLIVIIFFTKSIARSGLGRAFVAIRDNDRAAEAIGINIFYYKVVAFAICSFYAGIAGSLFAHYWGWVGAESFDFMSSIWWVGMAIIGGLGTTVGGIFGALLLILLRQGMVIAGPAIEHALLFLHAGAGGGIVTFVFGIVVLLFLIYEPRGLAHTWEVFKARYRLWPFSY
jgi:branched-chain amino acid transport system permease protein